MKQNLEFLYSDALISHDDAKETGESLLDYVSQLHSTVENGGYDSDEASLNLISDNAQIERALKLAEEKRTDDLKYIIVIGIGGSNLGTMAVYNALRGQLDLASGEKGPKMLFVDTVSGDLLLKVQKILEGECNTLSEVCFVVISKSGTTAETIANFEFLYAVLHKKFGNESSKRVVVITDRDSTLWQKAEEKKKTHGLSLLEIPKKVGGRYSVFSAVGLFPLALAGFDTHSLIQGALTARTFSCSPFLVDNPALRSAVLTFMQYQNGKVINNTFFFNPELEYVGRWYRQLMGESIGKQYDKAGKDVRIGITPVVSIGSTDLHSMAQLYFGGPRDKFTVIVSSPQQSVSIPHDVLFPDLVSSVRDKEVFVVMEAIRCGVLAAYRKNEMPFMEVLFPVISEYTVGQYLQYKMIEMMYLAQLLNVNAFDQPNVEDYKIVTKGLLT